MTRSAFQAALLIAAISGAWLCPAYAGSPASGNTSLGMDAEQVSQTLGVPLIYVGGRPGNEVYLAIPNVKGSALSSRNDGLYLQFRQGRLSGWKGDWAINPPCCN
jgi:hypothetical protein